MFVRENVKIDMILQAISLVDSMKEGLLTLGFGFSLEQYQIACFRFKAHLNHLQKSS